MSNDSYTEVTTTSWGSRLGNSFKGIITGIVLVVIGTGLLYWNEGRSVRRAGAIAEAELVTVDMPSIATVDSSFNGKLVYAKGEAKTKDVLTDAQIGISTTAIKMNRAVAYYQWVQNESTETVKKLGGGEEKRTTYTYELEWVSSPIDSAGFKIPEGHQNTVILGTPLKNEVLLAKNVTFGAYRLPSFLIGGISNYENLNVELTPKQIEQINRSLSPLPVYQQPLQQQQMQGMNPYNQGNMQPTMQPTMQDSTQSMMNTNQVNPQLMQQAIPQLERVHVNGNAIYLGENQATPKVGDMRITYTQTRDTNISIIAEVNGDTFSQYLAANGETFSYISNKEASKQIIFQDAKDSNAMMTWILRVLGIFVVVIGFKTILAPLSVLADVVPFLGNLVGMGTSLVGGLIGTAWSFIIIAIAWIRFRPTLAFTLIGIAVVFIGFTIWRGKSKKANGDLAEPVEEKG